MAELERIIKEELNESGDLKHLIAKEMAAEIKRAAEWITQALARGDKLLLFGNGGSAADAQHIAAEMVGKFREERRPLPAIALTTDTSVLTCIGNDFGYERIFSRQVEALANPGDVVMGISTSGNSPNMIEAAAVAKAKGAATIGLLGKDGGKLGKAVDLPLIVPSWKVSRIQEAHITIGHILCLLVEEGLPV